MEPLFSREEIDAMDEDELYFLAMIGALAPVYFEERKHGREEAVALAKRCGCDHCQGYLQEVGEAPKEDVSKGFQA